MHRLAPFKCVACALSTAAPRLDRICIVWPLQVCPYPHLAHSSLPPTRTKEEARFSRAGNNLESRELRPSTHRSYSACCRDMTRLMRAGSGRKRRGMLSHDDVARPHHHGVQVSLPLLIRCGILSGRHSGKMLHFSCGRRQGMPDPIFRRRRNSERYTAH